jgi:WD40 repeat protein
MVDLTGHDDFISAGCFSPDGTRVATASKDGTARLWPVDPAAAARRRMPIDRTLDVRDG